MISSLLKFNPFLHNYSTVAFNEIALVFTILPGHTYMFFSKGISHKKKKMAVQTGHTPYHAIWRKVSYNYGVVSSSSRNHHSIYHIKVISNYISLVSKKLISIRLLKNIEKFVEINNCFLFHSKQEYKSLKMKQNRKLFGLGT